MKKSSLKRYSVSTTDYVFFPRFQYTSARYCGKLDFPASLFFRCWSLAEPRASHVLNMSSHFLFLAFYSELKVALRWCIIIHIVLRQSFQFLQSIKMWVMPILVRSQGLAIPVANWVLTKLLPVCHLLCRDARGSLKCILDLTYELQKCLGGMLQKQLFLNTVLTLLSLGFCSGPRQVSFSTVPNSQGHLCPST